MDNLGGSVVEGPSTSEPESGGGFSHGSEPRVRGPEGQPVDLDSSAVGGPPDDHGISEDQRSRAVGGYIAGNPDIVTTGADDPTQGPYTREDITVRRNDAGDLVVGPSEMALERVRQDRYGSFAEGVAYSDRAMFDEARAESSYFDGVAYSDRDLVGAADDAARDSYAEGVVFSDLGLYREEIGSRIEEAGGDPDGYRVSVKSTDVGFAVSTDLVRDPSAGPVARWARGVTGDPLGGYRDDVFGRRERIEGRRREAVDELGDALVTTDARVRGDRSARGRRPQHRPPNRQGRAARRRRHRHRFARARLLRSRPRRLGTDRRGGRGRLGRGRVRRRPGGPARAERGGGAGSPPAAWSHSRKRFPHV